MNDLLPIVAVVALALACPLGMAALGVGAWLVARARGKKKELSMNCMGGHEEHQQKSTDPVQGSK